MRDKKWNVAYIHVSLNNARQSGGGTLTIFMYYGVNLSPDLFSEGMSVSDKKWNAIHVLYQTRWRRNTHVIWGEHLVCERVT